MIRMIVSYVTEIVWPLGFADVTFRVERSDDWKYVCVRRPNDYMKTRVSLLTSHLGPKCARSVTEVKKT